jgi:hypothetical protein
MNPIISKSTQWNSFGGDLLVLNTETGRCFNLNRTGILLWNALVAGTDESTLHETLCREYSVNAETSREHAFAFLRKLESLGLLS